jgi:hypothetical protein
MPAFSPLLFLIVRPNLGREHDSVSTTIPGIYLFAVTSSKRKKTEHGGRATDGGSRWRSKKIDKAPWTWNMHCVCISTISSRLRVDAPCTHYGTNLVPVQFELWTVSHAHGRTKKFFKCRAQERSRVSSTTSTRQQVMDGQDRRNHWWWPSCRSASAAGHCSSSSCPSQCVQPFPWRTRESLDRP